MTITDQAADALVAVLQDDVTTATTIDTGIKVSVNTQFDRRVIVSGTGATLRHPFVPGKYDVTGEVLVQQSADSTDSVDDFRALCNEVRLSLETKDTMPDRLESKAPGMLVYSFIQEEQSANPSQRGLQAIFQWNIFAELPIN